VGDILFVVSLFIYLNCEHTPLTVEFQQKKSVSELDMIFLEKSFFFSRFQITPKVYGSLFIVNEVKRSQFSTNNAKSYEIESLNMIFFSICARLGFFFANSS
jgi:hypothetical protein